MPVASTSRLPAQQQSGFVYREADLNKQIARDGPSIKGKERAFDLPTAARTDAPGNRKHVHPPKDKRQRKEVEATAPNKTLLKRLAGPSTGKAGLKRDPDEVAQIIYECSKGSPFYLNEVKRDEDTTRKVDAMLLKLEGKIKAYPNGDLSAVEREVDALFARLENTEDRHLDQTVVVADGDCFYCAVEELDDPSLKGTAFCVGGGVLTTASYEARKWGVRSAMAGFIAKKLCPKLKFVKPDFRKYSEASKRMMDVLRRWDPNMAPASLDEAYLNITEYLKNTGKSADEAVAEMRAAVKAETGLTISCGAGCNKMIAKIAADVNKPDGQCVIEPTREHVLDFLRKLPVRKIPGIGRVTERYLDALGVVIINDIYKQRARLYLMGFLDRDEEGLGLLTRAYLGYGSAHIEPGKRENRKSVGCETTFATLWKEEDLYQKLREIADSLAEDLARTQFSARTITLTYKPDTFERLSRAHTAGNAIYVSTADELYKIGKDLLDRELHRRYADFDAGRPVKHCNGSRSLRLRLLGLRATNLRDEAEGSGGKRESKASIASWATKNTKTPSPKRKIVDLDESEPTNVDALRPEQDANHHKRHKPNVSVQIQVPSAAVPQTLESTQCPICSRNFSNIKLSKFNRHIDQCLQGNTVPPPSKSEKTKDTSNAFTTMMKARPVAKA